MNTLDRILATELTPRNKSKFASRLKQGNIVTIAKNTSARPVSNWLKSDTFISGDYKFVMYHRGGEQAVVVDLDDVDKSYTINTSRIIKVVRGK